MKNIYSLLVLLRVVLRPILGRGLLIISFSLFSVNFVVADNNQNKQDILSKKITKANDTLQSSRQISNKLKKNVRFYEDKLFTLSRELHSTEKKINRLTTKLTKSNKRKQKLLSQTEQQKDALAQQMQALYTSGKQSHLRLLLKQDDPSDISRTVKYFEYLNQYRLKRIRQIKKHLDKINTVQIQIEKDTQALNLLQKEQSSKKASLRKLVRKKDKVFQKQHRIVTSQEKILNTLKRKEAALQGVIQKLALKRQKEAKIIEKEKTAENLAKKKKLKVASKQAVKPTIARHYVPNKAFSSLRGKLAWPVRGTISNHYGTTRNTKQKWKGVLISALGGTNVHAVARGKVEFSGRLNGYGYLIIIRHDNNYRSLYAYNRSVYKKVGQIVKAGDIIAAVGNSGSQRKTGLYFEIRKGTSHRNPAKWCR